MLTQAKLKYYLTYNKFDGVFYWNFDVNTRAKKDQIAGVIAKNNGRNCMQIGIERKRYMASRLAWLYVYGNFPERRIEAIDGNPLNIAIDNLRLTKYETGVSFHKASGKFKVDITIGYYDTEAKAKEAYLKAKELMKPIYI